MQHYYYYCSLETGILLLPVPIQTFKLGNIGPLMGECCFGTHGASSLGLDKDAALRQVVSAILGRNSFKYVSWCPSQVIPSTYKKISGDED